MDDRKFEIKTLKSISQRIFIQIKVCMNINGNLKLK